MQILYISAASSERLINGIHEKTGANPGYAVQKFSRLLLKGFLAYGVDAMALSNPPISKTEDPSLIVSIKDEKEKGVLYKYIPFINCPILKHLCVFLYTFVYILLWGGYKRREKAVICDILSISACMGALFATKINRIKSVAVVTDIFSQMAGKKQTGLRAMISHTAGILQNWYSTAFTHYVLLTEQMNELVNPHHRPYVVMEALCDNTITEEEIESTAKETPQYVMYAGGLEEKYGLKCLVEGFKLIKRDDIKLVLFGHGSYVEELKEAAKQDSRIEYRGIAPTDEVVKAEMKATLLVNPRFSTEELTKYSFPSKNMEYMTTGTPLLTTKLPGMPKEYCPYVFLFDEETPEGYAKSIEKLLSMDEWSLKEKGKQAREFVLLNKNNIQQTSRIINLINSTGLGLSQNDVKNNI